MNHTYAVIDLTDDQVYAVGIDRLEHFKRSISGNKYFVTDSRIDALTLVDDNVNPVRHSNFVTMINVAFTYIDNANANDRAEEI